LAKKTIAELQVKTSGAQAAAKQLDRVGAATERVGKNQTRLGQASASAGRSFAAQSQGLGGLVGIYAAAAANVFAITAAFTALNRAAQFGTIIQGTQNLAQAVGSTATEVVGSLKQITDGQLSIVEAATQANLALSAGFNVDQIEQLGGVALKASRALGRNLTDSFQRITRGAIKLEPELLDEIGIFTRIEPAVEAYANSINKSVSQLTQFERRQAFVNQVIKDGEAAFADIQGEGTSTQEVFEKLVANFSDLAIVVGKFIADSLVPFAEFLDKNLGNRLILLGGIGALVFGKLREAAAGLATTGFTILSTKLNNVADKFANVNKLGEEFANKQTKISQAFVGQGAIAGPRGQGAQIKRDLAAGPLTTARALDIQKEVPGLLQAERDRRKQIREQIKLGNLEREKGNASLAQSQARSKGLLATQRLVTTQLKSSGVFATILAKGLGVAAVAANFLGKQLNRAFAVFNGILIGFTVLQTALSFFDIDLFSEIKNVIQSIGKDARDTANAIESIAKAAKAAGGEVDFLADAARKLGVDRENVESILSAAAALERLTEAQRVTAISRLKNELAALQAGFGFLQFKFGDDVEERIAELEKLLGILEGTAGADVGVVNDINKTISAVSKLAELAADGGPVDELRDQIGKLVNEGFLRAEEGSIRVANSGLFSEDLNLGVLDDANVSVANVARLTADAADKFIALTTALRDGGITASRASRDVGVLTSVLEKSAELLRKRLAEATTDAERAEIGKQLLLIATAIEKVNEGVQQTVNLFTNLDNLGKELGKTFGSSFKALDQQFLTGALSAETGKIARNAEEQQLFQAQNLRALTVQLALLKEQNGDQEIINALEQNITKAKKEAQAENLKLVQSTESIRLNEDKRLATLRRQLRVQVAQFELNKQINATQLANLQDQGAVKRNEQGVKLAEKANELARERVKTSLIAFENEQAVAKLQIEAARAARERDLEALKFTQDQQALTEERSLLDFRAQIAATEQRTVTVASDRVRSELAILDREEQNALNDINRREKLLTQEKTDKELFFREQVALINLDRLADERKRDDALREVTRQREAFKNAQGLELQKRNTEAAAIVRGFKDAEARKKFADTQAQINFEAKTAELELISARYELLRDTIEANSAFLRGEEAIIEERKKLSGTFVGPENVSATFESETSVARANITSAITDLGTAQTALEANRKNQIALNSQTLEQARAIALERLAQLKSEETFATELKNRQELIFDEREKQIKDEFSGSQDLRNQKLRDLDDERNAYVTANAEKLEGLEAERQAIIAQFAARKDQLEFELSYQARIIAAGKEITKTIEGGVVDGLLEVNNALIEGTFNLRDFADGLRSFATSLIREIQRIFFTKTIAEPAAEFLAKGFASGFNEIFGANSTGVDTGPIGFEGTDMSGAVTSAAGGLVHMAAGGMLRDRVPALLEPGEFVVRKAAAKAAGGPALSALNATGQMAGPVSVNIQNEGTPKDAEASAPRFDGEKFVVDIVLRDLSNNGPIRKSLRAGA